MSGNYSGDPVLATNCKGYVFKTVGKLGENNQKGLAIETLKNLCLYKITHYNQLTKAACKVVPKDIVVELAEECVRKCRYQQLSVILDDWHLPVFRMVSRNVGDSLDFCREMEAKADSSLMDEIRKLENLKSKLVITVLQKVIRLFKVGRTKIQVLDITNYPVPLELIVGLLGEEFKVIDLEREDSLKIVVDLQLSENSFLVNNSNLYHNNISIQVRNVYFSIFNFMMLRAYLENQYMDILQQLTSSKVYNISQLEGLQLSRLNLRETFMKGGARASMFLEGISNIFSENLVILDLSYNAININGDEKATDILREFFASLSHLKRLDLSGNRLTNNLGAILQKNTKLEYLNLSGTQLRQIDVSFLASLSNLQHLDVSSNKLSNKLNVLKSVFNALSNLKVLEMEDCNLNQDCILELNPYLKSLSKLEILNVNYNFFHSSILILSCKIYALSHGMIGFSDDEDLDIVFDQ